MGKLYSGFDITGFLEDSIGSFLNEIEGLAIEMMQSDDYDERRKLLSDIQNIMWQCNSVLR